MTSRRQRSPKTARLYPLRDAYLCSTSSDRSRATWGDPTTPNPPYGAVFTYSVGQPPAADAKLVLTIADDTGKQIRRLDLSKETGVHRVAWDLRGDTPPPAAGRSRRTGRRRRRGPAGGRAIPWWPRTTGRPAAAAGRYRATLGKQTGDTVTPIGQPQSFLVVPLSR